MIMSNFQAPAPQPIPEERIAQLESDKARLEDEVATLRAQLKWSGLPTILQAWFARQALKLYVGRSLRTATGELGDSLRQWEQDRREKRISPFPYPQLVNFGEAAIRRAIRFGFVAFLLSLLPATIAVASVLL